MRRMVGIVMVVALTAALAVALVDVMAAGRMARQAAPAKTIEQLNAELDSRDPAVRREAARQLGEQLGSAPAGDPAR